MKTHRGHNKQVSSGASESCKLDKKPYQQKSTINLSQTERIWRLFLRIKKNASVQTFLFNVQKAWTCFINSLGRPSSLAASTTSTYLQNSSSICFNLKDKNKQTNKQTNKNKTNAVSWVNVSYCLLFTIIVNQHKLIFHTLEI